jgi:tetratricopeptide (TPR) repeat protein
MARNLDSDMRTLRQVLDLAQQHDFAGAAALAEATLADGFEHPLLLNVAATRLEQLGQHDRALPLLERAVAIAPADVGARNALGLCLLQLDRPREALLHFDELLKRHPELPFAHASRGTALIALGLPGRAEPSHLQAVQLEPGNFVSLAGLASIAAGRGQYSEATRWAERALALVPGYPDAVLSLAAAQLSRGEQAAAESRLRQLIIDSRSGPADRARAAGLLGDVLDAGGRYAEAYDCYQACNAALTQIYQYLADANVGAYTRGLCAALETVNSSGRQRHTSASVSDAAGHVFLLGFPRSGATLIEVALAGSPRVVSLDEHELLIEGVRAFMREPVDFKSLADAGEAETAALQADYWRRVRAAGIETAGKVFIDKHPLNTVKLPLIAKLFPEAKILFAVRDPRDVVFSCFRRRLQMNPSTYECLTLPGAAAFYSATMQLAQSAQLVLGLDWHEVRHEQLVADFEREMHAICQYIGLDWEPSMRDFALRLNGRERATPSTAQLSHGLISPARSHWRHYEAQLSPVLPVLAPWLEKFGYAG